MIIKVIGDNIIDIPSFFNNIKECNKFNVNKCTLVRKRRGEFIFNVSDNMDIGDIKSNYPWIQITKVEEHDKKIHIIIINDISNKQYFSNLLQDISYIKISNQGYSHFDIGDHKFIFYTRYNWSSIIEKYKNRKNDIDITIVTRGMEDRRYMMYDRLIEYFDNITSIKTHYDYIKVFEDLIDIKYYFVIKNDGIAKISNSNYRKSYGTKFETIDEAYKEFEKRSRRDIVTIDNEISRLEDNLHVLKLKKRKLEVDIKDTSFSYTQASGIKCYATLRRLKTSIKQSESKLIDDIKELEQLLFQYEGEYNSFISILVNSFEMDDIDIYNKLLQKPLYPPKITDSGGLIKIYKNDNIIIYRNADTGYFHIDINDKSIRNNMYNINVQYNIIQYNLFKILKDINIEYDESTMLGDINPKNENHIDTQLIYSAGEIGVRIYKRYNFIDIYYDKLLKGLVTV